MSVGRTAAKRDKRSLINNKETTTTVHQVNAIASEQRARVITNDIRKSAYLLFCDGVPVLHRGRVLRCEDSSEDRTTDLIRCCVEKTVGNIVGIKRLLDDLEVTAAKVRVIAVKHNLVLLINFDETYAK
ncbi:hypothetical protein Tco_1464940 [Tanacetum coccineum]